MCVKIAIVLIAFVGISAGQVWDGLVDNIRIPMRHDWIWASGITYHIIHFGTWPYVTMWAPSWDRNLSTHFYTLPQTFHAAVNEGWTHISGVDPPAGVQALGYYDDPTFVLLFDHYNNACGFQYAFPVSDVENSEQPMKYELISEISTKRLNGVLCYTATVYFEKNEANNIRKIWVQEKDSFVEIPTYASEVPANTKYLRRGCIPSMGTHYYTITPTTDCASMSPFFFLSEGDYIVGVGFQGFGVAATTGARTWWETLPISGLLNVIPDAATCVVDAMNKYGVISLHVWFRAEPRDITCPTTE